MAYLADTQLSGRAPSFVYDQHMFTRSRSANARGFQLDAAKLRTTGGVVDVDWYDSALALTGKTTGAYVSLYIDGRRTMSSLVGALNGIDEKSAATLQWAGRLPAGKHSFTIRLDRVDRSVLAPFVPPAGEGIDSLSLTQ